eukprot:m.13651 g.13651  ORF g.13651 m.13651 type:complete len:204 (-) comp10198_c0_seq1:53-664(-)
MSDKSNSPDTSPSRPSSSKENGQLREYCIGFWQDRPRPGRKPVNPARPCGVCYGVSVVTAENRNPPGVDEISALRGVRVMMLQRQRSVPSSQQPSSQTKASSNTPVDAEQPAKRPVVESMVARSLKITERIHHTIDHKDELPEQAKELFNKGRDLMARQLDSLATVTKKIATRQTLEGAVELGYAVSHDIKTTAVWLKDNLIR